MECYKFASLYKSDRINSLLDFGDLDLIFKVTALTEIATIDWLRRWGTSVFSENAAICFSVVRIFLDFYSIFFSRSQLHSRYSVFVQSVSHGPGPTQHQDWSV